MKQKFLLLGNLISAGRRFLFPDSPTNAWFLTPDERTKAVQRIKARPVNVINAVSLIYNSHRKIKQV
jgi:ACS family allantoate permease-like MFS transporter